MQIKRSGSQASTNGPIDWFTGAVRIEPLFEAPEPARVRAAGVMFESGGSDRVAYASTWSDVDRHVRAWTGAALGRPGRRNPTRGCCLFASNEKHWHGATPTTAMTHIAIKQAFNGKVLEWMERVSDEQYWRS